MSQIDAIYHISQISNFSIPLEIKSNVPNSIVVGNIHSIIAPKIAPKETSHKISSTTSKTGIKRARGITRATSMIGATALGVFTGLATVGTILTPVGWGIAGATLVIGLAGSQYCGGSKQSLTSLKLSVLPFACGLGAGLAIGSFIAAQTAGLAVSETGDRALAAYFGGFILYVGSYISTIYTLENSPL